MRKERAQRQGVSVGYSVELLTDGKARRPREVGTVSALGAAGFALAGHVQARYWTDEGQTWRTWTTPNVPNYTPMGSPDNPGHAA